MVDATQKSVSAEAEAEATQQNAETAQAVAESGAVVSTDQPAPGGGDPGLEPAPKADPKDDDPPLSPRDEKMARIVEKRKEQRDDQGTTPKQNPEDVGMPDNYHGKESGGTVTLKVNGEETEVPAEKVLDAGIRSLQKESAADKRLEEAGQKMSDLDAREQRIETREQELKAAKIGKPGGEPAPSAPADVPAKPDENLDEQAETLVDELWSGDKEKATGAVKTILERSNAATPTPNQQVSAEDVATIVEQRQEASATLKRFYERYPEVENDVNLYNIVNNESKRIYKEHPEYSLEELMMESGKYVMDKYGGKVVDDTGFVEKVVRKEQTDTVTGADVTRQPQPEEEQKSRKQVVSDMREDRR
jgi:hypothetical protein